jgi:membrane protease YdiL (CAAX protease family)
MIKLIVPVLLAFIFGLLYGRKLKFTGNLAVAVVAGFLFALLAKSYPYYTVYYSSLPTSFSEVFFTALLGVLLGSLSKKHKHNPP